MRPVMRYALVGIPALAFFGSNVSAAPVTISAQFRLAAVSIPSPDPAQPRLQEEIRSSSLDPDDPQPLLDRAVTDSGQTNRALAGLNTDFENVADDVFRASGRGEARYSATRAAEFVLADVTYALSFELAEERAYTLRGVGTFLDLPGEDADRPGGPSTFSLNLGGADGTIQEFGKAEFDPGNDDGAVVTRTFSASGTLAPGLYSIGAIAAVSGGTSIDEIQAAFQFEFSATPTDGGGGGGNPIPLPAAVWPAGLTLLALAGAAGFHRRCLKRCIP